MVDDPTNRRRRWTPWIGWLLAVLAMLAFSSLGAWQLRRMHEKRALLAAVDAVLVRRQARPLAVAADPMRRGRLDWAEGTGRFVDGPAILLDNQQRDGRTGVRVYRIFAPEEGDALLVELGWLPLADRAHWPVVPVPAARTVAGLLMPPPSAGLAAQALQRRAEALLVTRLVPQDIATETALSVMAPRILKLDPGLPIGYPRDLDVLPNTLPPERHLGYAVQWFGLALTVLATALLLTFRSKRHRTAHERTP